VQPFIVRGIATLLALMLWGWMNFAVRLAAPVLSGAAAVRQLDNSDLSWASAQTGIGVLSGQILPTGILLLVLVGIWWRPLSRLFAAASLLLVMTAAPSFAYYDKSDWAEWVEILPNQSAFLIPEVGANKDSQAAFMSETYLRDNKVAAKRVQIPHVKLDNSGTFSNFYVPGARLIVVDRTPYNREWVSAANRGTSARDEGFRFESADSVNISTGITIAAYVTEEDAAKFLYWFGVTVDPHANLTDPAVNFASVLYGRSLASVMDTVGRGRVQALLAREFGKRSTDDGIHQKAEIMSIIEKDMKAALAAKGITVDYVGFAEALTFDDHVQSAINEAYIASKDAARAQTLAPAMANMEAMADIRVRQSYAAAIARWDGKLPALPGFVVVPPNVMNLIDSLLPAKKTAEP